MDYQNTYSWKMALGLVPGLLQLAEELPSAEEQGFKRHLQDLSVDLLTAIGQDLSSDTSHRQEQAIKLQATLATIEAVYPAIDVSDVAEQASALEARLTSAGFAEQLPQPATEEAEASEADVHVNQAGEGQSDDV